MAKKYLQGFYVPKNPQKYVGDPTKIFYRSSWELKVCVFFDTNPGILKWQSEEVVIPYYSPADGRTRRYYVDFTVLYKTRTGETKRAIVEIKPKAQIKAPKIPKRQTKRYINEVTTFITNTAKWEAAKVWADKHNFEFMILDEDSLGITW